MKYHANCTYCYQYIRTIYHPSYNPFSQKTEGLFIEVETYKEERLIESMNRKMQEAHDIYQKIRNLKNKQHTS